MNGLVKDYEQIQFFLVEIAISAFHSQRLVEIRNRWFYQAKIENVMKCFTWRSLGAQ